MSSPWDDLGWLQHTPSGLFGAQGVQKKKKRLLAEYDKNAEMKEEWPL